MQSDGNLELYQPGGAVSDSRSYNKGGRRFEFVMQPDGNAVVYSYEPKNPIWSSQTNGKGSGPYSFILQSDRNMVIYDSSCEVIWESKTVAPKPQPDGENCRYVTVQEGENCQSIADDNMITIDEVKEYNKNTYGWAGCDNGKRNATCPLNICCSKDGFCDTTPEHCGKGCQSNCDSMAVESISFAAKKHDYTHIHFAFGALDFDGNIAFLDKRDTTSFEKFAGISGNFKKVLSIGGWAFNDPPTEKIFSRVMADPNKRKTLIRSVADVMRGFYLDGIDFDWEYPVAEMSKYLDYIVYMTYDLHGQWEQDIKNKPAPFLMSHVNWTETKDALRMMTRAGVPTHKVIMGVGAYGRSFKQERIDCHTPDCKFVRELATPGECTSTGGDLSWNEINRALQSLNFRDYYYDQKSDSDIMLYGVDQWVAYTTPETIKVDKSRDYNKYSRAPKIVLNEEKMNSEEFNQFYQKISAL